ncbi:MAG TPA: hypothetical protein VG649_09370 [Candidatus Angelobacter sp.]|jgi:hypothetical protein|nr:hypothetical protein [Candidatus Angelobacter sp.]
MTKTIVRITLAAFLLVAAGSTSTLVPRDGTVPPPPLCCDSCHPCN